MMISSVNSKYSKYFAENILIFAITLLFLLEALVTLILFWFPVDQIRLLGYYKIAFQIAIIIALLFMKVHKKLFLLILFLSSIFLINLFLNPILLSEIKFQILHGSIYYFDKYIFVFLLILLLNSCQNPKRVLKNSFRVVYYFLLLNSVLIIAGAIFDISLFKSYVGSQRFGFDGLFNKPNEATLLYSLFICYLYYQYKKGNPNSLFILLFVTLSAAFIGTKTLFLFLLLLSIIHVVLLKNNLLKIILLVIPLVFLMFFKTIIGYILNLSPFWSQIYQESNLVSALLSFRDVLFFDVVEYTKANWDVINYFFGGIFYTKEFKLSQMDGPDLYFTFGAIGVLIFALIVHRIFIRGTSKLFKMLFLSILICGFLSGALFLSTMNMLFLYLVKNEINSSNAIIKE